MKRKTLIVLIIVFAILSAINISALTVLNVMDRSYSSYSVDVLGTVFKEANKESNIIEIDLIRPPRTTVFPGETTYPEMSITNTADFDIYLRATYRIDVRDGEDQNIFGFDDDVHVKVNDGWEFDGRYWTYTETVKPGEEIPGFIESINYDNDFSRHLDYQVYIPVLIESVQATGDIKDVDNWPNKNIKKIKVDEYIDNNMSWTQSIKFDFK